MQGDFSIIMELELDLLQDRDADEYEQMLLSIPTSMLYASYGFQNFLKRILVDSDPLYIIARQHGNIVGALPAFLCKNLTYGNVLNSLPFYGSNGGILISPKAREQNYIKMELLRTFYELAEQRNVSASTIVSSPFETDFAFYEDFSRATFRDERIGQITLLPEKSSNGDLKDKLFEGFHKHTRNSIRKAEKSNLEIGYSGSLETFEVLAQIHTENIESVGGLPKTWNVFKAIHDNFSYDQDYRVYTAQKDGQVISALLVFFYNRTAEYFTPATVESERIYQPMSQLIFEAMQEAVKRGCVYWNWGGTWLTQTGVYNFKSRWGTRDFRYYYYIREHKFPNLLRTLSVREMATAYPYYYVLPYSELQTSSNHVSKSG
jgi:hypothetical protein